ncbi:hypothetical protein BXZ70DRAFT_1011367 [Cristinia sonorae]|uniref:F-box domain-containing protein n=1 Tax=Cristinia sonorae TaxID=1940300 RepID=A0A8K0XLG8_9AGAR|nr:hypothetical protein BXZ70DRAFT_1011367 [Cristinia sonorae]
MSISLLLRRNSLQLPAEICDKVIDCVACPDPRLWKVREDLVACSLVCRAWVSRSFLHLLQVLTLRTAAQLKHAAFRMSSTSGLSNRVRTLVIDCLPGIDQSWVPLVPLHLPKLEHLKDLAITRFDFTREHRKLYENCRLLRIAYLEVAAATYSQYAQVTRLASAVFAKEFSLHGPVQSYLVPKKTSGYLQVGNILSLNVFSLHTTWRDLQDVSKIWTFRPTIKRLAFHIVDFDSVMFAENSDATWRRIADQYHHMSLFTEYIKVAQPGHDRFVTVRWRGRRLFYMRTELHCEQDRRLYYRKLCILSHCGNPQLVVNILRGVASSGCQLHAIALPHFHDAIASQFWDVIDECLANSSFTTVDTRHCGISTIDDIVDTSGSDDEDRGLNCPIVDKPFNCLHEEYRERMPRTAGRGFFRCDPQTCELSRTPHRSTGSTMDNS